MLERGPRVDQMLKHVGPNDAVEGGVTQRAPLEHLIDVAHDDDIQVTPADLSHGGVELDASHADVSK